MLMTDNRNEMIAARLRTVADWNAFAQDILSDMARGRLITANRMIAAEAMMDKIDAKPKAQTGTVDLSRIRQMFDAAVSSGHHRPVYLAEGLKITLAPAHCRNAGALYVVDLDRDEYQGKVEGVDFKKVGTASPLTYPALLRIAADPLKTAIDFGRLNGRCACCGRKLTNKVSVDLGIGPICKENWGF